MNEAQLPGFVQRVDSWMARGYGFSTACQFVGIDGEAMAQVRDVLEAE